MSLEPAGGKAEDVARALGVVWVVLDVSLPIFVWSRDVFQPSPDDGEIALQPEQARRLSRLLLLQRLRTAAKVAAIVLPILALLLWFVAWPDPVVRTTQVEGTVTHWGQSQSYASFESIISITLRDGSRIQFRGRNGEVVRIGQDVLLNRNEKKSGAVTYQLSNR